MDSQIQKLDALIGRLEIATQNLEGKPSAGQSKGNSSAFQGLEKYQQLLSTFKGKSEEITESEFHVLVTL